MGKHIYVYDMFCVYADNTDLKCGNIYNLFKMNALTLLDGVIESKLYDWISLC